MDGQPRPDLKELVEKVNVDSRIYDTVRESVGEMLMDGYEVILPSSIDYNGFEPGVGGVYNLLWNSIGIDRSDVHLESDLKGKLKHELVHSTQEQQAVPDYKEGDLDTLGKVRSEGRSFLKEVLDQEWYDRVEEDVLLMLGAAYLEGKEIKDCVERIQSKYDRREREIKQADTVSIKEQTKCWEDFEDELIELASGGDYFWEINPRVAARFEKWREKARGEDESTRAKEEGYAYLVSFMEENGTEKDDLDELRSYLERGMRMSTDLPPGWKGYVEAVVSNYKSELDGGKVPKEAATRVVNKGLEEFR